ncbi:hypothetical protein [Tautonia rosea]|uniref:hypothetical protein n=1 Tax=Tautonia rosea TaxID=2728037 RepID=UPI0014737B8A|nr:hypothetical protein [Tautonia rosea]
MTDEIRAIAPEDVPSLSQFLTEAFGVSSDATFAAPDILRWKLFDPMGGPPELPSGLVAIKGGQIVGSIGLHPTTILQAGTGVAPKKIPAIHPIDWVVSESGVGMGARLLMRVHRMAKVHLAIGLTPSSTAMGQRTGYVIRQQIPVWRRLLKPWYRLRNRSGGGWARRVLGSTRDAAGMLRLRRSPITHVALESVSEFGHDAEAVIERLAMPLCFTRRDPSLLNHFLRFPRPWFEGWMIRRGGSVRGFLILSVLPQPLVTRGKIVDCFLDDPDPDLWLASIQAATEELRRRGADLAECFATTPWITEALRNSGYRAVFEIPCYVRDRSGLIPQGLPFHLTQLEADYAYT